MAKEKSVTIQLEFPVELADRKLDAVYRSTEKTRKYIWTFVVISVIALVLPLIGMVFAIPAFLNTYSSIQDL